MLRLARSEPDARVAAVREVLSPTPGVVFVNVTLSASTRAPLHWRAGMWDKPPLDVEIRPEDGWFQALQIVLQDEGVPLVVKRVTAPAAREGVPVFDTSGWVGSDRYLDEPMAIAINRDGDGRLEAWLRDDKPASVLTIDDELDLLVTAGGGLVAIRVRPLTAEEWTIVSSAGTR